WNARPSSGGISAHHPVEHAVSTALSRIVRERSQLVDIENFIRINFCRHVIASPDAPSSFFS
ncbi:hypothetical protein ACFONL_13530, partial [Camelimonas fluminis]